jgi:hypothetical protein
MKNKKVKTLIKEVLKELYRQRSRASSTYDDYEIEFDALVIPGLSTENDMIKASVSIGYDTTPGESERGMFGPPERSSPGEGPSVEIIDSWPTSMRIQDKSGKETEYDPNKLTSEQQIILHKAIEDYVSQNEESITNTILDTLDFSSEPTERDYDVDEVIQPQYVEDRDLKASGLRIVESLVAWGVNIEKWNIYEQDKNTIILQLYFKLIKSHAIWILLNMVHKHNGELRMYPDKTFIGADIKMARKNLR